MAMAALPISPSSLYFLLFSLFTIWYLNITEAKCHPDDEAGLLGFKAGIKEDPSGMLGSWKSGTDCCTWSGVACLVNNRVTSLSLLGQLDKPDGFLSGTISATLSKLRYLDGIYLQNTQNLSGPFPTMLFLLPNLKFVYVENNKLFGQLPQNIGTLSQINALSFARNLFKGKIPSSISELTQLTQLNLGGNFLIGEIPEGIRQLKNLTLLNLERNQLSGEIPNIFSSFPNLRILRLSRNKLSGGMPMTISGLASKLMYLELGHNALTGHIPSFIGKFRSLDTLDLSHNRFSGIVPKSFSNLTKIFNLDLSHNALVDPFPTMYVKGIESLDLSYNHFNLGEIPKWVTSSPIIYSLKLASCGIKMKIDDWAPSETYFYDYIDLANNQISGSPSRLLNRTDFLVGFSASSNQLKFNMEDMKFVNTLKYLDLSRNLVQGKVPHAVSGLEKLNVSHNHLCGRLPATKFIASAFAGNDCLCGSPLPPCKLQHN